MAFSLESGKPIALIKGGMMMARYYLLIRVQNVCVLVAQRKTVNVIHVVVVAVGCVKKVI